MLKLNKIKLTKALKEKYFMSVKYSNDSGYHAEIKHYNLFEINEK